jgi:hypothetical protein
MEISAKKTTLLPHSPYLLKNSSLIVQKNIITLNTVFQHTILIHLMIIFDKKIFSKKKQ